MFADFYQGKRFSSRDTLDLRVLVMSLAKDIGC